MVHVICWNGHQWAYVYDDHKREQVIQQIYRDSRRTDCGFPLYFVFEAARVVRG